MFALSFLFSFLSLFLSKTLAFTFTPSALSECDDLTVEWEGGTGPFTLLFIPVFGTPLNVSIPATAITGGRGSFSTPVTFPAGQELVLTMSDSTGFAAGGTTNILTVGPSKGGKCDSSEQPVAFPFQLNQALQQCRPFTFEGYGSAQQPVTITMIIPGGESVVVRPPSGQPRHTWIANVAAGTSMIFMMTDARGRQGGASDIRRVGASDDSSCINDNSPSSTLQPPTSTNTPPPTTQTPPPTSEPSATAPPAASQTPEGTPISAIAGTVIGSLLFLAVIVTLGLFFLKNLKKKSDKKKEQQATDFHHSARKPSVGAFYDGSGRGPNSYCAPPSHYPSSPNSAAPFDNPFSDSTPMGTMSPADPNYQYAYQQQSDPFHTPRQYYPPPPLVPPAQDPFNSDDSSSPGAMKYSTPTVGSGSDQGNSTLSREPSAGSMPVTHDGYTRPTTQDNERRRRPSRGFSVRNPSPSRGQNTSRPTPPPPTSPFM